MHLPYKLLFALLMGLGLSGTASAVIIEVEGVTVEGMGRCGSPSPGSSQPCIPPPAGDNPGTDNEAGSPGIGLDFDWLILDLLGPVESSGGSVSQTGNFGVGDTGSVASNPTTYDFFLPTRRMRVSDATSFDDWFFDQAAHITIGVFSDTLVIDAIGPHTFTLDSGTFTFTVGGFEATASGDPPVELIIAQVPLSSTLALLGLGLGLIGWRRRLAA